MSWMSSQYASPKPTMKKLQINPTCKRENIYIFKPSTLFSVVLPNGEVDSVFYCCVVYQKCCFFVFFVRLSSKNLDRPKQLYSSWILAWRNSDNKQFCQPASPIFKTQRFLFHRWVGEFSSLRMDHNSGSKKGKLLTNDPDRIRVFFCKSWKHLGMINLNNEWFKWHFKKRSSLPTLIQVASPRKTK